MWACHESANRLTPSWRNEPRLVRVESRIWASSLNVPALRMAQKSWEPRTLPLRRILLFLVHHPAGRAHRGPPSAPPHSRSATQPPTHRCCTLWRFGVLRRRQAPPLGSEGWRIQTAKESHGPPTTPNTDKAVCTDLHSASVTRLAVYIHTLAPSGQTVKTLLQCRRGEVGHGQRS